MKTELIVFHRGLLCSYVDIWHFHFSFSNLHVVLTDSGVHQTSFAMDNGGAFPVGKAAEE
jgi:hypothetical protein